MRAIQITRKLPGFGGTAAGRFGGAWPRSGRRRPGCTGRGPWGRWWAARRPTSAPATSPAWAASWRPAPAPGRRRPRGGTRAMGQMKRQTSTGEMRCVREMQRAVCRNETLATSPQLEKDLNRCSPRCCLFARTLKFDFYVSGSLTLKTKKTPHCFGPHCFATVLLVFYQF